MLNFEPGAWMRRKTIEGEVVIVKGMTDNGWVEVIDPSQLHWEVTRQYQPAELEQWAIRAGEWAWWLDEEGRTVLHKGYKNWGDEIMADIGNSTCKRYHCLEPFIGRLPATKENR